MRKTARENTKYSRNGTILKIGHFAKEYNPCEGYRLCRVVSLNQKLRMAKTSEKPFYKNIRVALCKKPLEKHQIFEKWSCCEGYRPYVKRYSFCKGYSPCKRYSFCKMVSLGQKVKISRTCEKPFYKNIRVVLCKKPFEKTPNILEMARF